MPRKKPPKKTHLPAPDASTIRLGSAPGQAVLDLQVLLDTRMLVCANSGGGKSHLLRLIAEQMMPCMLTFVLDPEGEFATLREQVDAVVVGPEGEIPTSVATASKLARRLVERNVSAIIDLYDLSKADKRKFVNLFLRSLLALPRPLWKLMGVLIDEAHMFAPEGVRDIESRDAVIALMDQGRKRGIGGILATQRLSKLAKDAAAEANNLCIGRFAQDIDLRRASDLLGFTGKSEWSRIRNFEPGEFFGVGPAFVDRGVLSFRSGAVKTTHPRSGQRHHIEPPKPSRTILAVVDELSDLQAQVDEEQSELERLRSEVSSLRKGTRKPDPQAEKRHAEAVRSAYANGWDACRSAAIAFLSDTPQPVPESTVARGPKPHAPTNGERPPVLAQRSKSRIPTNGEHPRSTPNGSSSWRAPDVLGRDATAKLLCSLLQLREPVPRSRAALVAGLSPRSSTFRNACSKLRTQGFLLDVGGQIAASPTAIAAHGDTVPPLPRGDEVRAYWGTRLSGAPGRVFAVLCEDHRWVRDDLAHSAGLSPGSSTYRNALSKLRTLGLIETSREQVWLSLELMGD